MARLWLLGVPAQIAMAADRWYFAASSNAAELAFVFSSGLNFAALLSALRTAAARDR
jgi:hypothetical protein